MKRKLFSKELIINSDTAHVVEELRVTEKEFGELITDKWELVKTNPRLQKKAFAGAKRLKELRVMLITRRFIHSTVQ